MAFESSKEKSERVPQWLRDFININQGFSGEVLLGDPDAVRERLEQWQKEQEMIKRTNNAYVEKPMEVPPWMMRVLTGLADDAISSDETRLLWKRVAAWVKEQDVLAAVPGVDEYLKRKKKK